MNSSGGGDLTTPSLSNFSNITKTVGDTNFTLTNPTSNSGGGFTYTSSNTNVATIDNNGTVTIVNSGTTTITATQAAFGNYSQASITATLTVNASGSGGSPITPTLSNFPDITKVIGDIYMFSPPTSDSQGMFTYTSSNENVATIGVMTGMLFILSEGTTTITATQSADGNYSTASISATLTILSNS